MGKNKKTHHSAETARKASSSTWRKTMKDAIERNLSEIPKNDQKTVNVFSESLRALARNVMTADQIVLDSKVHNTILADYPGLFNYEQSPTQNFVWKLICSLQELDGTC